MKEVNIVKKVSVVGIIANVFLLIIKFAVGIVSNSQAMMADAIHSAEDVIASVLSYIGAKISSAPKDKCHPYGHGKAEYIFSFIISITMIIAAIGMFRSAILSILAKEILDFSIWLIIICIATIVIKLMLYIYTSYKYKKYNNILIKASMEDHRNDMLLTTSTLIGVTCGYFGVYIVDSIVGSVISIWILYIGLKLFLESYKVLMDTSVDIEKNLEIEETIRKNLNIRSIDHIYTKPVGFKHLVVIKISMDKNMKIKECHDIGANVKSELINKFDYIYDVVVHINPYEGE